jgi:20S proteasome subunit beta 2
MHVPYTAMGSGSLAALAILENNYRDGLTEEEAIEMAADAIQAGIFYDLGSGSNVNIISVGKKETKTLFNYRVFNKKEFQDETLFKFEKKVPVLRSIEIKWEKVDDKEVKNMMEIC